MGADPHDPTLIEIHQRLLGHVGYLACDFLLATLRVTNVKF